MGGTDFWQRAERGREAVLAEAVQLTSVEGIERVTLVRLAAATQRPPTTIAGLFGSKQGLQLAVLDEAERRFWDAVVVPAAGTHGLARLERLLAGWLQAIGGGLFRGGCFLCAALQDTRRRAGPVRDRVTVFASRWTVTLEDALAEARQRGEVDGAVSVDVVLFRAYALGHALDLRVKLDKRAASMADATNVAVASLAGLFAELRLSPSPGPSGRPVPRASSAPPAPLC